MLPRSRVTGAMDTNRVAAALSKPGIDPRVWLSLAVVVAVNVKEDGAFADVMLFPQNQPDTVRVPGNYAGPGFGSWMPLETDDEVLIAYPQGQPNEGGVIIARLWSKSDATPTEAQSNSDDPVIHVKPGQTLRIVVDDGGKVIIDTKGQGVELGGENLLPTDGVVHGSGIDPFTGLSYTVLGNTSTIVKAEKG